MSRVVATSLLALVLVGGALLPAVPCLAGARPSVAIAVVYAAGSLICHQRPERSFTACGRQWPVCGRCAGVYLGAAAGAALALAGAGRGGTWRQWRTRVLLSGLPTAILWLGEVVGVGDPGTPMRFATALPAGIVTALWLATVARGDLR